VALSARAVSVELGGRRVLDDVHVDVAPGCVVVVAGGNGAGKSTLLRTLSGELAPTRGSVVLDERDLAAWPAGEIARRRAVLRQRTEASPTMTAVEVVMLGRLPHNGGVDAARDHAIAGRAMRRTGVDALAARRYATLSGGEKQRVQLARVLTQILEPASDRPRYLLLDEPTSGLDLAHQHLCLRIARRLARQGAGVLAVLHDLSLAARYADQVVLLRAGRIAATGPTGVALTARNVEEVFGVRAHASIHPASGRLRLRLGAPLKHEQAAQAAQERR
jgi:iron complex transport system ATP-binding protein